jgi:hypothetical protein
MWKPVTGRARCQRCGELVLFSWRYFETPTTWTRCYCETCVEVLLNETA